MPKRYPPEFRCRVLELVRAGKSVAEVAGDLGVSSQTIYNWRQQEQIDSGMLTQEQAKYSLNKNLVTRALGIEAVVPPDISEYRIEAEDIYVLCSDGLTDMVEADAVREIVATKRSDLAEAAAELIDVANQNGGRDNVSVVLVRVPEGFLPTGSWLQRWIAKKPT